MDRIVDKLFIGDVYASSNYFNLHSKSVSHILTLTKDIKPKFPEEFEYLVIHIEDTKDEELLIHLPKAIEFIKCGMENGTGVLVHCQQGISRSASIVIAYLMATKKKSFKHVFKMIKEKRPIVKPNQNFIDQLQTFEAKLKELDYDLERLSEELGSTAEVYSEEEKLAEIYSTKPIKKKYQDTSTPEIEEDKDYKCFKARELNDVHSKEISKHFKVTRAKDL